MVAPHFKIINKKNIIIHAKAVTSFTYIFF